MLSKNKKHNENMYQKFQYQTIVERIREPRKFIQVIMGPSQIGKTTVIKQALKALENEIPYFMFSADNVLTTHNEWISDCWDTARAKLKLEGNKDILFDTVINKPALLRQTFELGANYSGQIISLTKIVGSLQDAGNTTTLSGYLNILKDSGLLKGIQKFSVDKARQRASIPKFQVFNSALRNVYSKFRERYKPYNSIVVGKSGIDAETFLKIDPVRLFS